MLMIKYDNYVIYVEVIIIAKANRMGMWAVFINENIRKHIRLMLGFFLPRTYLFCGM